MDNVPETDSRQAGPQGMFNGWGRGSDTSSAVLGLHLTENSWGNMPEDMAMTEVTMEDCQ